LCTDISHKSLDGTVLLKFSNFQWATFWPFSKQIRQCKSNVNVAI